MLRKRIGIDLGTSSTKVWVEGKGIVMDEPTVVAIAQQERKIVAIGKEAKSMLGKVPQNIVAKKPLVHGVIANYKLTEALLTYFLNKSSGNFRILKPEVMVSVPAGITSVEERAVIEATLKAGASKVYLIPEPIAAAIGSNMPISTSSGNMIVNIGGGTTEIAVMSLNGIVSFKTEKTAGDDINDSIVQFLKKKYSVFIGEQMAEKIKKNIVSAITIDDPLEIEIRGRDVSNGNPNTIKINSNDLVEAIRPILDKIVLSIKEVLENTPPELASDVIDRGVVLSGGSAQLLYIDEFLSKNLNIPFFVVDDPLHAVVRGLGESFKNIEMVRRSLTGS